MEQKQYKVKPDKYTKARGGESTIFSIACNKCRHEVLLYQKDGGGPLLRMYVDKILASKEEVEKAKDNELKCPACKRILAIMISYEKENRLAYRIFVGAIRKSLSNGIFPKKTRQV